MEAHRLVASVSVSVHPCHNGCSNFDFIEQNLSATYPIQRFFSIMRQMGAKSLVLEKIPLQGLLHEDLEDLQHFGYWSSEYATRISFWSESFHDAGAIEQLDGSSALGYLILKDSGFDAVHAIPIVYEGVCNIEKMEHGIYPSPGRYSFKVVDRTFEISGFLYCQQNGLTSKCSHVALRSILSSALPQRDFSYREMNRLAGYSKAEEIQEGFGVPEIRRIVKAAGLSYYDVYYDSVRPGKKLVYKPGALPFHSFVYSGVESGCGSVLGFKVPALGAQGRHIIPFWGHTFDPNIWAADAQSRYLHSKRKIPLYLSSEIWTDRFIGHDDNFGANITIPQYFISSDMLSYVMSIYNDNLEDSSGVFAEAEAVAWFYQSLSLSLDCTNSWCRRLKDAAQQGAPRIVMRALCLRKEAYVEHVRGMKDACDATECNEAIDRVVNLLPDLVWMVEFSVHQLFQINRRKLGEIVFDAAKLKMKDAKSVDRIGLPFVVARVPGCYFIRVGDESEPDYDQVSSRIGSHVGCYRFPRTIDFDSNNVLVS